VAALFSRNGKGSRKQDQMPTFVSRGCLIEGAIRTVALLRVDGSVHGDIVAGGGLIVGEEGSVKGNVEAAEVLAFGSVHGDISASHVEIKGSGRICGRVTTRSLVIEDGAVYNGFAYIKSTPGNDTTSPVG
jgi:cytoskeletal protein CcmA (bactofilin family)